MAYSILGDMAIKTSSRASPLVYINAATGVITCNAVVGNVSPDALDFIQPNVNAQFNRVNVNGVNSAGEMLGNYSLTLHNLGNPVIPNLTLYLGDQTGTTALYNAAISNYQWKLAANGDFDLLGNIHVGGHVDDTNALFITANYSTPNDGKKYEYLINAASVGANPLVITLPEDPASSQEIGFLLTDKGTATIISIQTGTPALQFVGEGSQTNLINLLNAGPAGGDTVNRWLRLKFINYGAPGDWWVWTV